jgi:hypothetical protein
MCIILHQKNSQTGNWYKVVECTSSITLEAFNVSTIIGDYWLSEFCNYFAKPLAHYELDFAYFTPISLSVIISITGEMYSHFFIDYNCLSGT